MPELFPKEQSPKALKPSGTDYKRLVALLRGTDGAMKRRNISLYLGCSVRQVKKMAEAARNAGIPIGYSTDNVTGGVFLCKTPTELKAAIKRIEGLAYTLLDERRLLKNALLHMENRTLDG